MKRIKLPTDILHDAKPFYSNHSLKETTEMILKKYEIKMCRETLRTRFSEIGISIRSRSEAAKLGTKKRKPKKSKKLDENLIVRLYVNNKFSQRRLVKLFRVADKRIREILVKHHVRIRKREEATSLMKTTSIKKPFSGDLQEKAYLAGLCLGDLHVEKYTKFTIRIATSSSKWSFIKFLIDLFSKYTTAIGCVKTQKGYNFYAYLDRSFDFLLEIKQKVELIRDFREDEFLSFLSGFIDAEGCMRIQENRKYPHYFVKIGNTNLKLLVFIKEGMKKFGIKSNIYLSSRAGKMSVKKSGETIISKKDCYVVQLSNKNEIIKFLRKIQPSYKIKQRNRIISLINSSHLKNS